MKLFSFNAAIGLTVAALFFSAPQPVKAALVCSSKLVIENDSENDLFIDKVERRRGGGDWTTLDGGKNVKVKAGEKWSKTTTSSAFLKCDKIRYRTVDASFVDESGATLGSRDDIATDRKRQKNALYGTIEFTIVYR